MQLNRRSFLETLACAAAATGAGAAFGADGHVRLSYCCADGLLAEGLDRLERFVKKIGGGA